MRLAILPLLMLSAPMLAADGFPLAYEATRYDGMKERSPFVLATARLVVDPPPPSFTASWKLVGLGKLPDAAGVKRDWVMVRSQDQRVAFSLYGDEVSKEPEAAGVSVDHVEWNASGPRKSKVYLRKGAEVAPVEFGEDLKPSPQPPVPGSKGAPGQRPIIYPNPPPNAKAIQQKNGGPGTQPQPPGNKIRVLPNAKP